MSDDMKALLTAIPMFIIACIGGFIAFRAVGGWRGIRTPRILGPMLLVPVGLAIMLNADSRMMVMAGAMLMVVAGQVSGGWTAVRYVQLTRTMDRIDPFLTGSPPMPFPVEDPACRKDLATAARLLVDPALSFRYDADLPERIAAIQAVLPLLPTDSARD